MMPTTSEIVKAARPIDLINEAFCGRAQSISILVGDWRERTNVRLLRGVAALKAFDRVQRHHGGAFISSMLFLRHVRADGCPFNLGLAALRLVTTAGVQFMIDDFQGLAVNANMKFHAIGTSNTAEVIGDTALGAEITAPQYSAGARATGSQGEGAAANVYRTTGTNTVTTALAIVEHGIFDTATRGAGVLLDRSIFGAYNLAINDQLQSQYDFTINSGG